MLNTVSRGLVSGNVCSIVSVDTYLAVDRERPGAAAADAAHVVVGERARAKPVIGEVELDRVLAGRERRPLPLRPHDALIVVDEHRLALQQVQAPAVEAAALVDDHAVAAALGHVDLGGDRVGLVEQARHVAFGDVRDGQARVVEHRPARGKARARRDEPRRGRGVERQHLVLGEFAEHQVPHLLHLLGVLRGDVGELRPVVLELEEFDT